ncbi:MAG: DUF3043 domain-containing protein [Microbacteriaceae bacterium]
MAKHTPTPEAFEGENEPVAGNSAAGKGRATPSRAEQEAARRRPLVANTKEAKAAARAELAAKRDRARVGMAAGEEKYLPVRDRGPQKRWVRDYIDSQWHLGEFVIPLMVLVIVIRFVNIPMLQLYAMIGLWGFIILVIIDMAFTSWRTKRAARAKFGESRMEKGLGWYAAMRSLQMRVLRMPKPQVRRGQRPE